MVNEKLKETEMIEKEKNDHKKNQLRRHQKKMVAKYPLLPCMYNILKYSLTTS